MLKITQDDINLLKLENNVIQFQFFKRGVNRGRFNITFKDFNDQIYKLKDCYSNIAYFEQNSKKLMEYNSKLFIYNTQIEELIDDIGEGFEIICSRDNLDTGVFDFKIIFKIYDKKDFLLVKLIDIKDLKNISPEIHSISPFTIQNSNLWLSKNGNPSDLTQITWFKNGWQSWSPCKIFFGNEKDRKGPPLKIFKRTLDNQDYEIEGRFYSEYCTAITDLSSKTSLILGFVTLKEQFSRIILDYKKPNQLDLLTAFGCMDGVRVSKSSINSSEELFIGFKAENLGYYGLIEYAEIIKKYINETRINEIPIGWCTWYYYFTDIGEDDIIRNLEFFEQNEEKLPIDFIQLDDGYFTKIGDYKNLNNKFPHGLLWLFKKINESNFKGGLWTAPFFAEKKSRLLKTHKNWFITKKGNKKLLKTHYNWGTFEYSLDLSQEDVLEFLTTYFRDFLYGGEEKKISTDLLIEYFKIDFLHAAAPYDGDYKNDNLTRAQIYHKGIQAIRNGITDDSYLLGCGSPLGPAIGLVDAMRIGTDTAPKWKNWDWVGDKLNFSLPSLKRALINTLYRSFMHKNFWINDPDCLMIRRADTDLNLNEIQLQLTLFGLSGGQILISDDMTKLSREEINDAKLLLPPYNSELTNPIVTDAFISKIPTIYFLETQEYIGKRYLAAIINWEDDVINRFLSISEIVPNLLRDENRFFVFDFWNQTFLGEFNRNEKINLQILPHHCSYLSIIYVDKELKKEPIFLSSNLHISQGTYEITDFDYDEDKNSITMIIDLIGEREGEIFIILPPEKKISNSELQFEYLDPEINIWKIKVNFTDNALIELGLSKKSS